MSLMLETVANVGQLSYSQRLKRGYKKLINRTANSVFINSFFLVLFFFFVFVFFFFSFQDCLCSLEFYAIFEFLVPNCIQFLKIHLFPSCCSC